MREMTDEEGLVDGHVLVGMDGLPRLAIDYPVHQEEGIAMGQMLQDFVDIHCVQAVVSIRSSFLSGSATRPASFVWRSARSD